MSPATSQGVSRRALSSRWIVFVAVVAIVVVAALLHRFWLPAVQRLVGSAASPVDRDTAHSGGSKPHSHDRADHDDLNSLELSPQARKNIGLELATIELQTFVKTITVPGMIVERPGRSLIEVTAPMTGIVTRIFPLEGEAVVPGQPLFEMRLTHEELVQLQAELLQTAEEIDVVTLEIRRIELLTEKGGLAGKQLLERQYEHQKLEAVRRSKRQALLLHGLSNDQVDGILKRRELLKTLTVVAPDRVDESESSGDAVFQVQNLRTAQGKHVNAGDTLAVLSDHAELYIEGQAFERDVSAIGKAVTESSELVSAVLEGEDNRPETVSDLRVLYLAPKLDSDTRTLDFYVTLPNVRQRDRTLPDGRRFVAWHYRPGQRVQLRIPVAALTDRIVLPIDAIAEDGIETFVFAPNGDLFERRGVHLEYRDPLWAVIANDGSVFPGEQVAITGAQQLQLAIKNKSSGGLDPHAGHDH